MAELAFRIRGDKRGITARNRGRIPGLADASQSYVIDHDTLWESVDGNESGGNWTAAFPAFLIRAALALIRGDSERDPSTAVADFLKFAISHSRRSPCLVDLWFVLRGPPVNMA